MAIRPEVLLVHNSVIADDEALNAGHAIFRWRSGQRKPADHDPLDHIVKLGHWRCRSLTLKNLEVITMIGLRIGSVALCNGFRHVLTDRSFPCSISVLPGQARRPRSADDFLRVLVNVVTLTRLVSVLVLCIHIAKTDLNRAQFVRPDPAKQHLLLARLRVEIPLAGPLFEWNRKRPILVSDIHDGAVSICGVYNSVELLNCHLR